MTTTHTNHAAGKSHCERILSVLESASDWVDMPTLALCSGSYNVHSRISDMRKNGHDIEHRQKRDGRTVCSEYRIRRTPCPAPVI